MGSRDFAYTGCDNLEAMTEAVKYNKYLIRMIEKQAGAEGLKDKKILDFGAGSGTYADMFKKQGTMVECVEPDKSLQKILTSKGYRVASYADKLKPNSYDIIYALNVMEHVEDDHLVFDQLAKALKKNGVIIIYVPAFQSIYTSMDRLVGHHRRYRKTRLRAMAERNDLTIKKLQYVDAIGYAAALTFKALGNKKGTISPASVRLYDRLFFPVSKALGPVTKHIVGKNVVLVAKK